ncbi:MAG TPA: nuclear transport factor 2 family protein [Caulobacteraceae bacterium]
MTTAFLTDASAKDEAAIRLIIDAIIKAHHDKDAAAIAAPYALDAALYDLAPPLCHQGHDLKDVQAWLDTWDGPIENEARDFKFEIAGDLAFGHGYFRLAGMKKGSDQPISFWMRATMALRRDNGRWRIVHEHTSVPFYMDGSLKPAFDLEP